MFDWPEQTQTSPIKIFFKINRSSSSKVTVYGPPAAGVLTPIRQLLSPCAVIKYSLLFQDVLIVILIPGLALPHN
ncbi:hypothetical protein D3C87_1589540 [compost metagenome]